MVSSDRFFKLVRHMKKEPALSVEETLERLRGFFFSCTRELPESLQYDLFDHFAEELEERPEAGDVMGAAERLGEVIDLFHGEYDDERDPFTEVDWDFIREASSESASEMDVKTLTYVMQHVLDRGRM